MSQEKLKGINHLKYSLNHRKNNRSCNGLIGNDFVERIYSVMKNLCTHQRNRLSVAQVKAQLCIKFNFSMTCPQFYNHISKNRKLIECAKSEKKYDFLK
jgi:hypothetical protein